MSLACGGAIQTLLRICYLTGGHTINLLYCLSANQILSSLSQRGADQPEYSAEERGKEGPPLLATSERTGQAYVVCLCVCVLSVLVLPRSVIQAGNARSESQGYSNPQHQQQWGQLAPSPRAPELFKTHLYTLRTNQPKARSWTMWESPGVTMWHIQGSTESTDGCPCGFHRRPCGPQLLAGPGPPCNLLPAPPPIMPTITF